MIFSEDSVRDSTPLFRSGSGGSTPTSSHQLFLIEYPVKKACKLNAVWHSRFPKIDWSNVVRNRHYVCYSFECDSISYAVAIWSSPIAANRMKDGDKLLELRRMAIAPDAPKNTASRMLSVMRRKIEAKFPDVVRLVSYQDTEVHKGTIYKASGWRIANIQEQAEDWTNTTRKRSKPQSTAPKVRWEYDLRPNTQ